MKELFIWLFVFTFCLSCTSQNPDDFTDDFLAEKVAYDRIINYLEKDYLKKETLQQRVRLIFMDCDESYFYKDQICDDALTEEMKSLGIQEIEVHKKFCRKDQSFDRINFMVHHSYAIGVVFYVYDFCEQPVDIQEERMYYKTIEGPWSLMIDKN